MISKQKFRAIIEKVEKKHNKPNGFELYEDILNNYELSESQITYIKVLQIYELFFVGRSQEAEQLYKLIEFDKKDTITEAKFITIAIIYFHSNNHKLTLDAAKVLEQKLKAKKSKVAKITLYSLCQAKSIAYMRFFSDFENARLESIKSLKYFQEVGEDDKSTYVCLLTPRLFLEILYAPNNILQIDKWYAEIENICISNEFNIELANLGTFSVDLYKYGSTIINSKLKLFQTLNRSDELFREFFKEKYSTKDFYFNLLQRKSQSFLLFQDYAESIYYDQKILIFKDIHYAHIHGAGSVFARLIFTYKKLGENEKANLIFEQWQSLTETSENLVFNKVHSRYLAKKSEYLYDNNKKEKAQLVLKQAIQILEKDNIEDNRPIFDIIWRAGVYISQETEKIKYAQKLLNIYNTDEYKYSNQLTESLNILAEVYFKENNIGESAAFFQKAIKVNTSENGRYYNLSEAWVSIVGLGNCYYYIEKPNFIEALNYYRQSFEILNQIRNDFQSKDSKLYFNEKVAKVTASILNILQITNSQNFEKYCFEYIELTKASNLKASISEQKAKELIPAKLLEDEKQIRLTLSKLETQYQRNPNNENYLQFFNQREIYKNFIIQIEEDFPKYHRLKYENNTLNLKEILSELTDNQFIINYFYSTKKLYIVVSANSFTEVQSISLSENFEEKINLFVESIKTYNQIVFSNLSYELYKILIRPINDLIQPLFEIDNKYPQLVIIPYGALYKLPFEALLSAPNEASAKQSEWQFLVNEFDISYHYSANLWALKSKHRTKFDFDFIGFAPKYTTKGNKNINELFRKTVLNKDFTALPFAQEEIINTSKLFKKSLLFINEKATKEVFLNSVNSTQILHFATHFYQSPIPQLSGIVLENEEIINYNNILNANLNTQLVILSSCESALGKMSNAEGMIAINRAFFIQNVSYVLSSLFKINDQLTNKIIMKFINSFKQSNDINKSLNETKRNAIKEDKFSVFHWSAFVLFGR